MKWAFAAKDAGQGGGYAGHLPDHSLPASSRLNFLLRPLTPKITPRAKEDFDALQESALAYMIAGGGGVARVGMVSPRRWRVLWKCASEEEGLTPLSTEHIRAAA